LELQDLCLKDKIRFTHRKDQFGSILEKKLEKIDLKARVIKAESAVSLH